MNEAAARALSQNIADRDIVSVSDTLRMVQFKFSPLQWVHIPKLECSGRIDRCIWSATVMRLYMVEYVINGEVKSREFYEDEIEEMR